MKIRIIKDRLISDNVQPLYWVQRKVLWWWIPLLSCDDIDYARHMALMHIGGLDKCDCFIKPPKEFEIIQTLTDA